MTSKTAVLETRHQRRATELSPAKSKAENQQALKTIKRRAQARRMENVTHRLYTWKDVGLALLGALAIYLLIWVWYLATR